MALPAARGGGAVLLGVGIFVASCGTVLFVLAGGSPGAGGRGAAALAGANARIEVRARAGEPAAHRRWPGRWRRRAGWLAAYGFALVAAGAAFAATRALPPSAAPAPHACARRLRAQLAEGARFVLGHPLLRGIFGCALAWNFGFFALLAVLVPYALGPLALNPGGSAWRRRAMAPA